MCQELRRTSCHVGGSGTAQRFRDAPTPLWDLPELLSSGASDGTSRSPPARAAWPALLQPTQLKLALAAAPFVRTDGAPKVSSVEPGDEPGNDEAGPKLTE